MHAIDASRHTVVNLQVATRCTDGFQCASLVRVRCKQRSEQREHPHHAYLSKCDPSCHENNQHLRCFVIRPLRLKARTGVSEHTAQSMAGQRHRTLLSSPAPRSRALKSTAVAGEYFWLVPTFLRDSTTAANFDSSRPPWSAPAALAMPLLAWVWLALVRKCGGMVSISPNPSSPSASFPARRTLATSAT